MQRSIADEGKRCINDPDAAIRSLTDVEKVPPIRSLTVCEREAAIRSLADEIDDRCIFYITTRTTDRDDLLSSTRLCNPHNTLPKVKKLKSFLQRLISALPFIVKIYNCMLVVEMTSTARARHASAELQSSSHIVSSKSTSVLPISSLLNFLSVAVNSVFKR